MPANLENLPVPMGFPCGSTDKESACNVGDLGLIPGLGKSPGGRHGNPLQYSCLENLHGMHSSWGRKELDTTEQLSLHYLWPQHWKRLGFIPIPKKGNAKEFSHFRTIALISDSGKVMLKIVQPGFKSKWTVNFQMLKLDLEKAEEPEIKLPTSPGSSKKQEN